MLRILEVAIGLALVFTLVAMICSLITEWISAMLEKRGNLLWEGIENLVDGQLRDDICGHQLMQGLVRRQTWLSRVLKKLLPWVDRSRPSYVPTEIFVAALLDILGARATGNPAAIGELPTSFPGLQAAIREAQGVPDNVKKALLALVNDAGDDLAKAKKTIGDWFDAGMARVTGWYKRWSQLILVGVGLFIALGFGVDSIAIGKRLWADPVLRQQVARAAEDFIGEAAQQQLPGAAPAATGTTVEGQTVSAAELTRQSIEEIEELQAQLAALTLPVHPVAELQQEYRKSHPGTEAPWLKMLWWWISLHGLGFLLTALAASLGAPFWFDVLNKIVNLRNTGVRHAGRLAKGVER